MLDEKSGYQTMFFCQWQQKELLKVFQMAPRYSTPLTGTSATAVSLIGLLGGRDS